MLGAVPQSVPFSPVMPSRHHSILTRASPRVALLRYTSPTPALQLPAAKSARHTAGCSRTTVARMAVESLLRQTPAQRLPAAHMPAARQLSIHMLQTIDMAAQLAATVQRGLAGCSGTMCAHVVQGKPGRSAVSRSVCLQSMGAQ